MSRPLLIGEAPCDLAASALGPGTRSGARLDRLLLGHGFDALNLLARSLGPVDDWPADAAAARAWDLYRTVLAGRDIVLLGRRVARAFRRLSPHLDSLHAAAYFSSVCPTVPSGRGGWSSCRVWLAPHPSGRSRWWNDAGNRDHAATFFSRILGQTPGVPPPALPTPTPPEDWELLAETRSWPRAD